MAVKRHALPQSAFHAAHLAPGQQIHAEQLQLQRLTGGIARKILVGQIHREGHLVHLPHQIVRQHLHFALVEGLLDILRPGVQRRTVDELLPRQLLLVPLGQRHTEEHQQRVHKLLFIRQAAGHQRVVGVDQRQDLLKITLPVVIIDIGDHGHRAEPVIAHLAHRPERAGTQVGADKVPLRAIRVDGDEIVPLAGGLFPSVPHHAEELGVLHRGVADQNAPARVDPGGAGHGIAAARGVAQLQAVAHNAHRPANGHVHLREMSPLVTAQKGRQFHFPAQLVHRVGIVLHRLAQIIAQRNVHHILGVVHRHLHLALPTGAKNVVPAQIVAVQLVIARRRQLRPVHQITQHSRRNALHIRYL